MEFTIRDYEARDREALLDLWNRTFTYDPMSSALLNEKIEGDPDWEDGRALVAQVESALAGFGMCVLRGAETGFIKLLAVDHAFVGHGIRSALLHEMERRLTDRGATEIRVFGSSPNYLMPGIDPRYTDLLGFFRRQGYERSGDTANMLVDLQSQDFGTSAEEERLAREGFGIRRARAEDWDAVSAFVAEDWPPWVGEVIITFGNDPISTHIAVHGGKVVAFSSYDANNLNTGWFGPMGTAPVCRGKGIGGILLKRCLADMKEQGHSMSIIPWVGPIAFYHHYAGAVVDRVFWQFEKRG